MEKHIDRIKRNKFIIVVLVIRSKINQLAHIKKRNEFISITLNIIKFLTII